MAKKEAVAVPEEGASDLRKRVTFRIPDGVYETARAIYESTPGASFMTVAKECGVSYRALEERSRKEGGWKKVELTPELSDAAHVIANNLTKKISAFGDGITADQRDIATREVMIENALELRARLIERHRKEWDAPRKLAYEAMSKRDFELAKLAKINSETLRNIQDGERKAWGIDRDSGGNVTVVIERD